VRLMVSESGSIEIAGSQHQRIAEAIAAGNINAAGTAMGDHIAYSANALRQALLIPSDQRTPREL
jgi:DNA-binding FadR family transcriptional regulator